MRIAALFAVLLSLGACEPRFVENSAEVDNYLVRANYSSACVAFNMHGEDYDSLRAYTAEKLSHFPEEEVANNCVCEALYTPEKGWDPAVTEGLASTKRDDFSTCLAPAMSDESITDRHKVVYAFARIASPKGYNLLADVVKSKQPESVRTAAVTSLRPSQAHVALLLDVLTDDPSPEVRAAAAKALESRDSSNVIETVVRVATEDSEGIVRAAALNAVVKLKVPETNKMVCSAMLEDPEAVVRLNAVKSIHGTKKRELIKCLEKRLLTKEESGKVREAVLKTLGASNSDEAALVLCRAIGPVLRMYVTGEYNKVAQDIPGADIIVAQNNRDWERSYECVAAAKRQGGYSCYARNYLQYYYGQFSGKKVSIPWCDGMPNKPDTP